MVLAEEDSGMDADAAQPLTRFLVRLHGELMSSVNEIMGSHAQTHDETIIAMSLLAVGEAIIRALPAAGQEAKAVNET